MLKESKEDIVEPLEITEDELLIVHTLECLNNLKVSPTHLTLHTALLFLQVLLNVCDVVQTVFYS